MANCKWWRGPALALAVACAAGPAYAAEGTSGLDGSTLGLWWALLFLVPFERSLWILLGKSGARKTHARIFEGGAE